MNVNLKALKNHFCNVMSSFSQQSHRLKKKKNVIVYSDFSTVSTTIVPVQPYSILILNNFQPCNEKSNKNVNVYIHLIVKLCRYL